jgi:hypothetical protein
MRQKSSGKYTNNTQAALSANGSPQLNEAAKSPASNATAATDTFKKGTF